MVKIYIAVNGDDVGQRIGQAIASDNHEDLKSASDGIKQGHGMIEEWVEAHGGETVSSSGDEGIYCVPESALQELDQIREDYKNMSGHALTVGTGNSMSEASKALIYGKLNGKNQVVQYEPQIDDYISDEDAEEEAMAPEATEEESDLPTEEEAQDQSATDAEIDAGIEDPQAMEAQAEEATEEGDEIGSKHPQEPEHEEDMSQEAELAHDAKEQEEDELDPDNVEADEEQGDEGIDGMVEGEDAGTDPEDADVSGTADPAAAAEEAAIEEAQEMAPPEERMAPEAAPEMGEEEAPSPYDDIAPETEANPEEGQEAPPQEGEEEYDHNDALADMIHGHMEGEEDAPVEEPGEEEGDEALKDDIRSALMAFKSNRDMLEVAKEQSPEMYEATVTMLRAMIEMAKQLGYAPEQDVAEAEAGEQLTEEFPDAEAEEEIPPEMDEEEAEEEEQPSEKKR